MGRASLPDALRRALADASSVQCPSCRYDLAGLRGRRCPECGRNVEDALRRAAFGPRRRTIYTRDLRDWLLVLAGPTLLVAFSGGFWWALHTTDPPPLLESGSAAALVLMHLSAFGVWWRTLRELSAWAAPTRAAAAVLLWGPITTLALALLILAD